MSAQSEDESDPRGRWGDMARKIMGVGLGAAFMTEESIRGALGGMNLPKEVLANIVGQANRSKEDFMNKLGNETIRLLAKIDFVKEASRFVEEHKFRINAEIEIVKKDASVPLGEGTFALKSDIKIKD